MIERRERTKSTTTYSPSLSAAEKNARPRLILAIFSTNPISQEFCSSMKVLIVMRSRVQRSTSLSVSWNVRSVGG